MGFDNKKQLVGIVLDSKMEKTAVVKVSRKFPHSVYKKYITRTKKYFAHDANNICNAGDTVRIAECRPVSKLKSWLVLSIEKEGIK